VISYHFTKAAAHAFACRYYLFRKDYNKVIEHAGLAFPDGDIAGAIRPWNSTYLNLSRTELINTYTRSSEKTNLLLKETISDWATSYASLRYATGVARRDELFYPNVTGGTYSYTLYYGSSQIFYIPKFKEHFVQTGVNATTGLTYVVLPLFTAEEVLLNRAEAYTMLENLDAAVADMNTLMSKRITGYDPAYHTINANKLYNFYHENINQRATLAAVLDLRRAEFVHEGMRWFDILRHNIPVTHNVRGGDPVMLPAYDVRRTLQIPAEAISIGGLEPNPR